MVLTISVLAIAIIAIRIIYCQVSPIVADEFEHLHAAYLLHRGQTPYLHFFEHHTPLFYYLGSAVLPLGKPDFDTIVLARYLTQSFSLLTALCCWHSAKLFAGKEEARAVIGLYLASLVVLSLGSRVYLDNYAAPFLVLNMSLLSYREKKPTRLFMSGCCFGIAVLFTQKAVMAFPSIAIYLLSAWRQKSRSVALLRVVLRDSAAFVLGGLLPITFTAFLLGGAGIRGFVDDNIILNFHWKARHFPFNELKEILAMDTLACFAAIIHTARQLTAIIKRKFRIISQDLPMLFLLSLLMGIFVLPVVWEEYFLLLMPFILLCAAFELARCAKLYLSLVLSALLTVGVLLQFWYTQRHNNAAQRLALAYVLEHTSESDVVLDGYSGFGVFRLHAFPYWFLHEETQLMIPKDKLTQDIIQSLEQKKPAIVIDDKYLKLLSSDLQAYLKIHYHDSGFADIFQRN